jgi:hypothetical protein
MLRRLLPPRADNDYRGHKLALWIFALLVLLKGGIGLGTIFSGRSAAVSTDGIPLDTFGAAGGDAFVSLLAAWGLAQVALNLVGVAVLIRYRTLVSFMFALLLLEHLARRAIFWVLPMPRTEHAPGYFINMALVAAMIVGLALSLWHRERRNPGA